MEIKTHFNNDKSLLAIQDKSSIMIWDFKQEKYIQNYDFSKTTITNFCLKTDLKNPDSLNLIVSDVKGYFYIYNINKNILLNQFKIHDAPIADFKISTKYNNNQKLSILNSNSNSNSNTRLLVFSLDRNAVMKIFDISSGEILKSFKLLKEAKSKILFDVDNEEKYIVFSKGSKIRLLSLESLAKLNSNNANGVKQSTTKIGMHSQEITSLKFSSDSKFILSATLRDYVTSVWHLKNKDIPLFTFQNSFFPLENFMLKINKGIYHAISVSRENISVFKIDLKDIDPNEPLKPLFSAAFAQSNLISVYCGDIAANEKKNVLDYSTDSNGDAKNSDKIISAFYGNQFRLERKDICYSEKANKEEVKKEEIKISFDEKFANKDKNVINNTKGVNGKNVVVNSNKFKILNEIEMSKNEISKDNLEISGALDQKKNNQGLILVDKNNADAELTTADTKISLLNIIRNSLINNDTNQFEWALDQKDFKVIENTIARMDSDLIASFVNKIIDILQSNIYYRKNIIPWIKLIFEKHFAVILNLPLRTIENFNIIKQLISNRTQYKEKLEHLYAKLKFINDYYHENSKNKLPEPEEKKEYTPLLEYYESDDEETIKKNKEFETKLKKAQIAKTNLEKFKQKKFGDLTSTNDEFDFEDDSDLMDNFDENGDILDDGMSVDDADDNFKNKSKLKNEEENEEYESGEDDEVSLD